MRRTTSTWYLVLTTSACLLLASCASSGPDGGSPSADVPALKQVDAGLPGTLLLRDDHGIGSYDAFLIPASTIEYQRGSRHLTDSMEELFVATLEQSLADAAMDAEIPIARTPGACVMQIDMKLVDVDIEGRARGDSLGEMTLVMEFSDSLTGEPLLRYSTSNEIEDYEGNDSPGKKIRKNFGRMVRRMELGGALRAAGLADDVIRPGCKGTLADRGRAATPAVSAK